MIQGLVIENTVLQGQGFFLGFIKRGVPSDEDAKDILQ
jgi:hypothetical protein